MSVAWGFLMEEAKLNDKANAARQSGGGKGHKS